MAENNGKIRTVIISKSSSREYLEKIVTKVDLLSFKGSFEDYEDYSTRNSWEEKQANKVVLIEGQLSDISSISQKVKASNKNSRIIYVASGLNQGEIPSKVEDLYSDKCDETEGLFRDINERSIDGIFSIAGFNRQTGETKNHVPLDEHTLKRKILGFIRNHEIKRELRCLMVGGGSLANNIIRQLIGKSYCKSIGWYSEYNPNLEEAIDNLHGIPDGGEKIFQVKDLGSHLQSVNPDVIFIARGARSDEIDFTRPRQEINTQITLKSKLIMDKTYEVFREAKPRGLKIAFTNLPGVWLYEGFRKIGNSSKWTSFSSDSDRLRRIIYNTLVSRKPSLESTLKLEDIFVPVLGEHADEVAIHWENATIRNVSLEQSTREMNLPELDLAYFIKNDEYFSRSIVEFGNLIKRTASKTKTNDYDVASSVERYVRELGFFSTGSKMPWYSYVSRDRLKPLLPYADGFSLDGAYLMFPARISHDPTIKINRNGSFDLKQLPERMKSKLGRAMMRQNDLVKSIS